MGNDVISRTSAVLISTAILALISILVGYFSFVYQTFNEVAKTQGPWSNELLSKVFLLMILGGVIFIALIFFGLAQRQSRQLAKSVDAISAIIRESYSLIRQQVYYSKKNDYTVLEKTHIHTIESRESFKHKRQIKIRALAENISSWRGKYFWTGTKIDKFICSGSEMTLVEEGKEDLGTREYNVFRVDLSRPIQKGEERTFELEWYLTDTDHQAKPFVEVTAFEPVDSIMLQVTVFPNVGIKKLTREETVGDYLIVDTKDVDLGDSLTHTWHILNPTVGNSYLIRWKFP